MRLYRRWNAFWLVIVVIIIAGFVAPIPQQIQGKVVDVRDGDTIILLVGQEKIKIRLYGIDCPEKAQDFGEQATQYTTTLCLHKAVSVENHGKDKYRRMLGVVFLPNGDNMNQLLVKNGYAWRYKSSTDEELLRLQKKAERKKLGLWANAQAQAPWEFRKAHPRKD